MNIEVKNTGRIVQGHVLDCRLKPLLQKCQDLEPRLYFKWNPDKKDGRGVWEVRIKPLKKTVIYQGNYQGSNIFVVDYKENAFEAHIKDFDNLNYNILEWLRAHDTYQHHSYSKKLDYDLEKYKEKTHRIQAQDKKDYYKEHRKYFKHLQEEALSGRVHWGKLLSEADDDDRNW